MSLRVVVTGTGLATALGGTARETMRRALLGERAIGRLGLVTDPAFGELVGAEALPDDAVHPAGTWLSRADRLALSAAREALADAGIASGSDVELVVASSVGGMWETQLPLTHAFRDGTRSPGVSREALLCHPVSAPSDRVHELLGPFRSVRTIVSACSSGAVALGIAEGRIVRGEADVVLVGGVDAISLLTLSGFFALRSLDPRGARPFDATRAGLSLGEGAGFVVLETEERARARGARVIVEQAGFAARCEAFHITQPEESGATAEDVMRRALARAGETPRRVGFVSAHGTGTDRNDAMEAGVLARVVPDAHVASQKAQIGHTLAAAGAVETAMTGLALAAGRALPATGVETPMPGVRLADGTEAPTVALSNAFGFGGTDATVVLRTGGGDGRSAPSPPTPLAITHATVVSPHGAWDGPALAAVLSGARGDDVRLPDASRRIDPLSQLTVLLAERVREGVSDDAAVVASSAFGVTDRAAEFSLRVLEKGPRLAPPQEFPSLVPSSPGAYAAIALGLRGVSLSVADLGAGGVAALHAAIEVVRAEHAGEALVVAAECESRLAAELLSPLVSGRAGARGWGGAALRLSPTDGRPHLARVLRAEVVRGEIPTPPEGRFRLVATHETPEVRAFADRHRVQAELLPAELGTHEAGSGIAVAAGAGLVASGGAEIVVVLAPAPDRMGVVWLAR